MRYPFLGAYPINQKFNDPCCRQTYVNAFGWVGHNGIDYGLPTNTPLVAAVSGKVFRGFEANGYGNYIFITGEGYETAYGHLNRIDVAMGITVSAGQQIGLSGNTGFSSGPHLHYGVRPIAYNRNNGFGGYVDPQPLFGTPTGGNLEDGLTAAQWKARAQSEAAAAAQWKLRAEGEAAASADWKKRAEGESAVAAKARAELAACQASGGGKPLTDYEVVQLVDALHSKVHK